MVNLGKQRQWKFHFDEAAETYFLIGQCRMLCFQPEGEIVETGICIVDNCFPVFFRQVQGSRPVACIHQNRNRYGVQAFEIFHFLAQLVDFHLFLCFLFTQKLYFRLLLFEHEPVVLFFLLLYANLQP